MKKGSDLFRLVFCLVLVFSLLPVYDAFADTDSTGPEITDLRLEENGKTLTHGDVIHVSAVIRDASGIKNSAAYISCNSGNNSASTSVIVIAMKYSETSGRWEGTHTVGAKDKGGKYSLNRISATDRYDNQTVLSASGSVIINTYTVKYPAKGEWLNMDEDWRAYVLPTGLMAIGWNEINGVKYFFNDGGWMVTGWQQIGDVWYYFYRDGSLATDTVIDGCTLNSVGACVENSPHAEEEPGVDRWVEFSDGRFAFQFADRRWARGWLFTDGPWYYFDEGMMVTGWHKIDGSWVYFTEDGCLDPYKTVEGWCFGTAGDNDADNSQKTIDWDYGWQLIDGEWCYVDGEGNPVTGWHKIDGTWLFFSDDGIIDFNTTIEGWVQKKFEDIVNTVPEMNIAFGEWIDTDEGRIYVLGNGERARGMQLIGGLLYYFDENGCMVTGWQEVDGIPYYFSEYDGSMDPTASMAGWMGAGA